MSRMQWRMWSSTGAPSYRGIVNSTPGLLRCDDDADEFVCPTGSGESMETAVEIRGIPAARGIAAEYQYLTAMYGQADYDWEMSMHTLMESQNDRRKFDRIRIQLRNGVEIETYFDITDFYGRL